MPRRCGSALHRTREEVIDPRLRRLRLQRLLQVWCCSHVDAPLSQLLLGKNIRARACV